MGSGFATVWETRCVPLAPSCKEELAKNDQHCTSKGLCLVDYTAAEKTADSIGRLRDTSSGSIGNPPPRSPPLPVELSTSIWSMMLPLSSYSAHNELTGILQVHPCMSNALHIQRAPEKLSQTQRKCSENFHYRSPSQSLQAMSHTPPR